MHKITIELGEATYDIHLKKGLISDIPQMIAAINKGSKAAIITDTNVAPLYLDNIIKGLQACGVSVLSCVVPAGEASKSLDVAGNLYEDLAKFKLTRTDIIVALGGGVVGDLAGFVAATFLRGVSFVQIPTSLLAQIDSSVGGKVAVDIPSGKNLVGCFYQPKAVYIDPDVLDTLPDRYFYDGLGEVIKYACIITPQLFTTLQSVVKRDELQNIMTQIIIECLLAKKYYVERDERDTGDRMFLNFGHTIGHAIERLCNFEHYSHGESVAIGMYMITKASEQLGLTQLGTANMLLDMLKRFNLPYEVTPELRGDDFAAKLADYIGVDKKNLNKQLNLVLLHNIGSSFLHKISPTDIKNFL